MREASSLNYSSVGSARQRPNSQKSVKSTNVHRNLQPVVIQPLREVKLNLPVLVIGQQWPSWLVPVLAMSLPICGAFFPGKLHKMFSVPQFSNPRLMESWSDVNHFEQRASLPTNVVVLASGSAKFLLKVARRWDTAPCVPMILCRDEQFHRGPRKNLIRRQRTEQDTFGCLGFDSTEISHSDWGGATNSLWQIFS